MTRPPVPPAPVAATAVIPPHAGSGPLSPAQLRIARARMALAQLAVLVEDLEASPAPVRQAVVVELQARLARFLALSSTPPSAFLPVVSDPDRRLITLTFGSECIGYGSDCHGQRYRLEASLSRRRGLEARTCTAHLRLAYEVMVTALTHPKVKNMPWRTRRKGARDGRPGHETTRV